MLTSILENSLAIYLILTMVIAIPHAIFFTPSDRGIIRNIWRIPFIVPLLVGDGIFWAAEWLYRRNPFTASAIAAKSERAERSQAWVLAANLKRAEVTADMADWNVDQRLWNRDSLPAVNWVVDTEYTERNLKNITHADLRLMYERGEYPPIPGSEQDIARQSETEACEGQVLRPGDSYRLDSGETIPVQSVVSVADFRRIFGPGAPVARASREEIERIRDGWAVRQPEPPVVLGADVEYNPFSNPRERVIAAAAAAYDRGVRTACGIPGLAPGSPHDADSLRQQYRIDFLTRALKSGLIPPDVARSLIDEDSATLPPVD